MIVDLLRNDLSRFALPHTVQVPSLFVVQSLPTVHQMVSDVTAQTRPGTTLSEVFGALFPCGSITGAPKVRAMQLIAAAERERRGLYGGAIGYLGYDGNLDTAIAIRSAVLKDGVAHLHAGAGIVAASIPEREFEETEHKAAALRRALELASGAGRGGTAALDAAGNDAAANADTTGEPGREPVSDPADAVSTRVSR